MAFSKPTILFIPGFWHTAEGYGPLAKLLEKEGYPTVLVSMPSAGAHPGHPDSSQDIGAIRNYVSSLADEGKNVILVMHSGGSLSGSEAVLNLDKKHREAEGKKGGVVRMVYIGILLPKAGKTMYETFMAVVSSPDLDPNFEIDQDQKFHVMAEVIPLSLWL